MYKQRSQRTIQKAFSGEIKNFTGIDAPYENPQNPEIIIKNLTIDRSVDKNYKIFKYEDYIS